MTIPIDDIVSVSVLSPQTPFEGININSLALFTTSKTANADVYRIYTNASSVISPNDYETGSGAALMANAIFSQTQNVLTGGGYLIIVPMRISGEATAGTFVTPPIATTTTTATAGTYTTIDLSVNLANFQAIADGYISLQVDEEVLQDAINIDFTAITTIADIAEILQASFTDVVITSNGNIITITSNTQGTTSKAILMQTPDWVGAGSDLSASTLFNVSGGTAVDGTSAEVTNLNDIKNIADGYLQVVVDEVAQDLTNLDFTACTTAQDVIEILQADLVGCTITTLNQSLIFTSDSMGASSSIRLKTIDGATGTDLTGANYLNAEDGIITDGVNASESETLLEAINRVQENVTYSGLITDIAMTSDEVIDVGLICQARKIFYFQNFTGANTFKNFAKKSLEIQIKKRAVETANQVLLSGKTDKERQIALFKKAANPSNNKQILLEYNEIFKSNNKIYIDKSIKNTIDEIGRRATVSMLRIGNLGDLTLAEEVKELALSYTRCLYYTGTELEGNLFKASYASLAFSTNFEGQNTAKTLNLKSLVGIKPNAQIGSGDYVLLLQVGADFYGSVGSGSGLPSLFSTGGNDYWDNIYHKRWLEIEIQRDVFNLLKLTNTKIPQTVQGVETITGVIKRVFEKGKTVGFLTSGLEWQLPDTFGDETSFKESVRTNGYYIYAQNINTQNYAMRLKRQAPFIQCAATFSGAIHFVTINVQVQY